ncbi:arylsulfatase B-like [Lytechinus variegatus]|uniref:arylsulfatase B-like n=1 Tax=Lytechinus variegatus TaxID=7654 RepID=UPI001BB181A7|nr:arylsulfatase B-like [Lytechinus variegatus]
MPKVNQWHMLVEALFIAVLISTSLIKGAAGKPPHIVFIVADDYGWFDIGYHNSTIKTPILDQLASQGVKLENYYVQPICSPSRSQLMTGRYQIHTGLQHFVIIAPQPNSLPLNETTLPQKLKESGYATHLVGKWHLGFYKNECMPLQRGFDSSFGYLSGMQDYWTHFRSGPFPWFEAGDHWLGIDYWDNNRVAWEYTGIYSQFVFTERAQRVIQQHNPNQPLFLYLPLQSVHGPLQVPDKYKKPYAHFNNANRETYAGMVATMDEAVGKIVDSLKETGLWEDTVLVFTTDNGGDPGVAGINWPLRGTKNSLWEGGVHGTGFITGPMIPARMQGTVNKDLMHISDWFPTLIEGVAGGSTAGLALDSYNMWDSITKGGPSPRKELLHNIDPLIRADHAMGYGTDEETSLIYPLSGVYPKMAANFSTTMRAAIRMGDWKLLTGLPGRNGWFPPPEWNIKAYTPVDPPHKLTWLFNIAADPNEKNDLSDQHPEVVAELVCRLEAYYQTSVPVRFPDQTVKANPASHHGVWGPWE